MKATCPVCQKEFELTTDQLRRRKYQGSLYDPGCSQECRLKLVKSRFNTHI